MSLLDDINNGNVPVYTDDGGRQFVWQTTGFDSSVPVYLDDLRKQLQPANYYTEQAKGLLGQWSSLIDLPQMQQYLSKIDTPKELAYMQDKFDPTKVPHVEELIYQLAGFADQKNIDAWEKQQSGQQTTALENMLIDNPGMAGQSVVRPDIPDLYQGVADPNAADGGPAYTQALYDQYGVTEDDYNQAATDWAANNTAAAQAARDTDDGFGDWLIPALIIAGIATGGFGLSGAFGEAGTLGAIGGVDAGALAAADMAAGIIPASELASMGIGAGTAAGLGEIANIGYIDVLGGMTDATGTALSGWIDTVGSALVNPVVDTATNTAANVATGGGTDVGIWDDTLFDGISSGGSTTLDLGNLAAQDFADFGVTGVEALGDSLNYATTASDLTNGISWQSQLADVFRGMGLETNTALQLASSFSGDTGKNILTSLLKGNSGTTTGSGGNLLSTILSGLTGIYASQNKAQDLTEAAKYLTENSNPYRSYIKDGTVGGDGSVTSFMKGFQTPANNMATAASGYNDLLKTSYTDPLSIWNSPEMQGLNNIFKQQIDRRDSAAGRNSQYGARAVEMQNNFLANSLPKYRSGLNDALNTSATAASNFGKVATPPGTGETSQNVGSLLTGAADSGNNYAGAVGSMLDQIFNK